MHQEWMNMQDELMYKQSAAGRLTSQADIERNDKEMAAVQTAMAELENEGRKAADALHKKQQAAE